MRSTAPVRFGKGWLGSLARWQGQLAIYFIRWIGPLGLGRKAANVGRVRHPKYDLKDANQGTS